MAGTDEFAPEEEQTAPPLPPIWRRLVDLFVSPGQLFEKLAITPKWVGAVILGAVITALTIVLIPVELFETMMRAQFLESGQEFPGDPADAARIGKTVGLVAGPISQVIGMLLIAGLSTLIFAFVFGDRGTFKQYFAATAHAFLVTAIGGLIITPLRIASGDVQLVLSPGNALSGILSDGYLLSVLSSIDLFAAWGFAVLAIAATKIEPKRSFGSAFAIYVVFMVGFAMVRAIFT